MEVAQPPSMAMPSAVSQKGHKQPTHPSSAPFSVLFDESQIVEVFLEEPSAPPPPTPPTRAIGPDQAFDAVPVQGLPVYRPPSLLLARMNPAVRDPKFSHATRSQYPSKTGSKVSKGATPETAKTPRRPGRPKLTSARKKANSAKRKAPESAPTAEGGIELEAPRSRKKRPRVEISEVTSPNSRRRDPSPTSDMESSRPKKNRMLEFVEGDEIDVLRDTTPLNKAKRTATPSAPVTKEIGGQVMSSSGAKAAAAAAVAVTAPPVSTIAPTISSLSVAPTVSEVKLSPSKGTRKRARIVSGWQLADRPTLEDRISYLNPPAVFDMGFSAVDRSRLRVTVIPADESDGAIAAAEKLSYQLNQHKGIKAKVPKAGVVALPADSKITHIVVPPRSSRFLYITCAIANGVWRVPYEWAYKTIKKSENHGKTIFAAESSFSNSFRSRYRLFADKRYFILLTNHDRSEMIMAVLDQCGAEMVGDLSQADIVVVDSDAMVPDPEASSPAARYWIWEDFETLFKSATL